MAAKKRAKKRKAKKGGFMGGGKGGPTRRPLKFLKSMAGKMEKNLPKLKAIIAHREKTGQK